MIYVPVPLHSTTMNREEKTKILVVLWQLLEAENKVKNLFHDGSVTTLLDWIQVMNNDNILPCVIMGREDGAEQPYQYKAHAIAWLNQYSYHTARCHFVVIGQYHRKIGETIIDYWYNIRDAEGKRLINVVVGVTPETNTAMLKLVKLMGFSVIGTIPQACYMAYDGCSVGGVVSYYELLKGGK